MDILRYIDHPLLKNCQRKFKAGQYLFKEGDTGDTLFIIVGGKVRLVGGEHENRPYTVAILSTGEFLGERALLNEMPYKRHFSAIAETDLEAVEIGPSELALLEKQASYLIKLLLKRSFEIAEERLNRANSLVRVLRSSNNNERFIRCLLFLCEVFGRQSQEGISIARLSVTLHTYIDMDRPAIDKTLQDLSKKGILVSNGNDTYTVPDAKRLEALLPATKLAA